MCRQQYFVFADARIDHSYFLPKLDAYLKFKFEQAIAIHYYITGTSFQRIEEKNLMTALKFLHLDVVVLKRRNLSGPLLNKAYLDLKNKTEANLGNATFCLTSDAWSNVKNDPIVNIWHLHLFQRSFSSQCRSENRVTMLI